MAGNTSMEIAISDGKPGIFRQILQTDAADCDADDKSEQRFAKEATGALVESRLSTNLIIWAKSKYRCRPRVDTYFDSLASWSAEADSSSPSFLYRNAFSAREDLSAPEF